MATFKPGVVFINMDSGITNIIDLLDTIHFQIVQRPTIITSARDGSHNPNSKHYIGKAIDIRTNDLSIWHINQLFQNISTALGPSYVVLNEPTHIHIQYNH